jgi:CheY-like chemotaxis protein
MPEKASGSARILIAEDDELNRRATSAMLTHLGYSIDAVSNGKEVLQALDLQTYDIILMNLRMPEMSGLEATREIQKRFPLSRRPKIIALTAYATSECRDICLRAGMNDFMTKPVKMDDLANALKKHIQFSALQSMTHTAPKNEDDLKPSNETPALRLTSLMDLERQQPFS